MEDELQATAAEARGIAAHGFEGTTSDEIRDMFQPAPVSAEDILWEGDEQTEDDQGEETVKEGLGMKEIKTLLLLGAKMHHILEQDTTLNCEECTTLINSILEGYEEKFHAYVNAL